MKHTMFLVIKETSGSLITLIALVLGAVIGGMCMPQTIFAQTPYATVIDDITTFKQQKVYSPDNTGNRLHSILTDMMSYPQSEGLKKRLVAGLTTARMKREALGTNDVRDGRLLALLYYTHQSPVPAFIEDTGLRARVGLSGTGILRSEEHFWNGRLVTNSLSVLEEYPPQTTALIVEMTATVWFQNSARIYENTYTSWASDSLRLIYNDIRTMELAKHSVAVKLSAQLGYITIPTVTDAVFEFSGWPSRPIELYFPMWSSADIPDLTRLLGNPYYAAAAQAQLNVMSTNSVAK